MAARSGRCALHLQPDQPTWVVEIEAGSLAENVLCIGDVVLSVDGVKVGAVSRGVACSPWFALKATGLLGRITSSQ